MSEINIRKDHVNLLWTGGWDSTFRLLQLLLIYKCNVSPFYLIHEDRPSTGIELKTMKDIKNYIVKKYPHTKNLLSPTQYHAVGDILPDAVITSTYNSILKKYHVGSQYEWLARFCKEKKIKDMQLSIEKPHSAEEDYWGQKLNLVLSESIENSETIFRVGEKFKESDLYLIFQNFSFPIRKITKIEMAKITNEHGWNKIMNLTWFCHTPTYNMKPCGICKPCQQIINKGFGWRISFKRRIISFYYREIYWPLKSIAKSIFIRFGLISMKNHSKKLNTKSLYSK